eukprot:g3811.t1
MASSILLLLSFPSILFLNLRKLRKKERNIDKNHKNNVNMKNNNNKNKQPEEYPVYSIGNVRSCFRECRGTPRQGLYAPSTRGKIVLRKQIPSSSLDGLEHFSHAWILFVFHMNTNFHLTKRAHTDKSYNFRPKIKPPMLKGKSIGLFATRSPHRPNAVGITLAKIEYVSLKERAVYISALDLADGTPVVDIKPYVTPYDSVPTAITPTWCGENINLQRAIVTILKDQKKTIYEAAAAGKLRHYKNGEDVCKTITELLSTDIRPLTSYTTKSKKHDKNEVHTIDEDKTCRFRFDMLRVGFVVTKDDKVENESSSVTKIIVNEIIVESERDERDMMKGIKQRYPTSSKKSLL